MTRTALSYANGATARSNRAHGIAIHNDIVYCTDDQDSVIRVFDLDGNFQWMLGEPKQVTDTGYQSWRGRKPEIHHNEFVERAAGPFNCCCNVCIARNDDIFVADGYGNARIHHFDAKGTLLNSWGDVGTGPGEFHLPHGIALDAQENVIVAIARMTGCNSSIARAISFTCGPMCCGRPTSRSAATG